MYISLKLLDRGYLELMFKTQDTYRYLELLERANLRKLSVTIQIIRLLNQFSIWKCEHVEYNA